VACDGRITSSDPPDPTIDAQLRQNLTAWGVVPIGDVSPQDPALVELGRALFFDKILSGNRDIACATCHHPTTSLSDGLSLTVGTGGAGLGSARTLGAGRQFGPRTAPTLLNAGLGLFYMFWDARLSGSRAGGFRIDSGPPLPSGMPDILAAQALLPVLNRQEMLGEPGDRDTFGNPNELARFESYQSTEIWQAIMRRLMAIPEYAGMFSAAFPGRPSSLLRFEDAAKALAAFEIQSFTRTRSPFDRFLDRDNSALTADQKRGALLFFGEARCSNCHNGPFLGGQSFANVGVPQLGPGVRRNLPLDLGIAEIQENAFYRFAFRVAPLRNVELTAPYMHNGAYATLEAVVRHYDNVPLALSTYDVSEHAPGLSGMVHNDQATISALLETLDPRLRAPIDLTDDEKRDIVAFLKALTDPAARDLRTLIPPRVPSGLPVQ
jgi:cytochrome c peroxidase